MGETYACTFAKCDKVFSKAYELRKHKATHEDPNSVFYCSECDFITLQKKNLAIHFALHTGEKIHKCPDIISFVDFSGSPVREERCKYRTNDPAALSRHRKKAHGYIPPPNRTRMAKATPVDPCKSRQKRDEKASRYRRHSQRPAAVLRRKLSCVPRKANIFSSGPNYPCTFAESPKYSTCALRQVNVIGDPMDVYCYEGSSYDSAGATLVGPDEEMRLDTLDDPSLCFQWMAEYEEGYSTFDVTGMRHLPEPLHAVPSLAPASFDVQIGRDGCLCPEWMVDAGIDGWD
ncbi:hypothetical protein J3R82DRAFT_1985 [Butyriboletus roseoflavus]|nr:hypothetical protein J3R82DRAFT_1985 [Butyriboletus roseoflavus]